MFIFLIDDIVK